MINIKANTSDPNLKNNWKASRIEIISSVIIFKIDGKVIDAIEISNYDKIIIGDGRE